MLTEYRLSVSAQQQLVDIYRYTLNRWGEAQADHYAIFQAIAEGEVPGRLIEPEYGVAGSHAPCGKHVVFWKRLGDGSVGIAEILHQRMNIGDHLAGSAMLNQDRD